jgi:hypothetical protein
MKTSRGSRRIFPLLLVSLAGLVSAANAHAAFPQRLWPKVISERVADEDYLGARIFIEKAIRSKLPLPIWYSIRAIIFRTPQVGSDLVARGDRFEAATNPAYNASDFDARLAEADQLLLQQKFPEAFFRYQEIARLLKPKLRASRSVKSNAEGLYPYVLHAMGRALFSMKHYKDALTVYSWITPDYPKFRQILFERMWTSFKSGRVDSALGAIASQRSVYFSGYLEPEAYLVEIYIYKRLCRTADQDRVIREIADFKARLLDGRFTWMDWSRSDFDTRAILDLAMGAPVTPLPGASVAERAAKQASLRNALKANFDSSKKRLIEELNVIQAYSNLAVTPGMEGGLQPIEKLPNREALFKADLEIWPAVAPINPFSDEGPANHEEWADEVGHHRFIGESLCQQQHH